MFRKVLIANRGEIAVRIARACREMGLTPVAVYSDVDRTSLHVRMCDEAIHIGPALSSSSYLSIDKIIDAARQSGAEAIHPGYGFLSENPGLAEAVERAGLIFIGPSAAAMRLMGSKTSARQIAQAAGAAVVPGTVSAISNVEEALRLADEIGYPVMLKASAGGGGKGMRIASSAEEVRSGYVMAGSEAEAAFKDSSVYIEKCIDRPRHIEIQLMGDRHGNIVYLGERECSLQRRHQKVVEECPSPVIDAELRRRMGETAVAVAAAAGYWNAGTIEFLLDSAGAYYFLEMNTRLQVEHPVTEMVTGRDLVHEQIRIAAGEPLSFSQSDIVIRGAAIECRIYAEDPERNFMPSPGTITKFDVPGGPGVRLDSGVYAGWNVPMDYDPLLAKLCVWAETRPAAVARLARVLDECAIEGIQTTLPFFRSLARSEQFIDADYDTGFISRFLTDDGHKQDDDDVSRDLAAIAAVLHAIDHPSRSSSKAASTGSRWRSRGRLGNNL